MDESTGAAVVQALRAGRHDVLAVAEAMPQGDDSDILVSAQQERRILITNDFGELVFRSGQAHHGVLLLRLRDERDANRVRVVTAIVTTYGDRLAGSFAVASEAGVRIRPASRQG